MTYYMMNGCTDGCCTRTCRLGVMVAASDAAGSLRNPARPGLDRCVRDGEAG